MFCISNIASFLLSLRWIKRLAFILAALFLFQVSTPVLCAVGCSDELTSEVQSCCAHNGTHSCEMKMTQQEPPKNQRGEFPLSSKDCCTPCCAVPLCCCFVEPLTEIDFTSHPVSAAGQFPSGNGLPH